MEWFIALRYLRGKRKIGFISLIAYFSAGGVLLGSAVLVIALSVANGFEKEVRDRIIGIFAHGRIQQYFSRSIPDHDSLRQEILAHPDVIAAAPFVSGKASVEYEGVQEGVHVMGIDDSLESTVTELGRTVEMGALELDSTESERGRTFPGVLVGTGLADKLGVRPGAEIVLGTIASDAHEQTDPMAMIRAGRFVVTGIFETGMYEYDLSLVYISLESAMDLFEMTGAEGIQFKTNDLFRADHIAESVRDKLGGYPYRSTDWKNMNKSLFKWMKLERLIIFIVISLIIVVAAFNIISSLIMMILEKRREIGILMGMGATSGSIMKIFMLNGLVIGLLGSTLGVALATGVCYVQLHWELIPLPGDIYFITTVPVLLRALDVCAVYVSANVICFLATLYPAWKASRIVPAESLRVE